MARHGVAVSREREVKLDSHAGFEVPSLSAVAAAVQAHDPVTLTARYYDTPDLRLARWGVTLRRRTGGSDDGWTLKLPVDGAREEVTQPLEASPSRPPADLLRLVTAYARDAPLGEVETLVTVRTAHLLLDATGTPMAEVVADAVTARADGRDTARWHELEVEAKAPDADLEPVLEVLLAAGATRSAHVSKAVRALGPRAAAPADPPPAVAPAATDPARGLIEWALSQHTRGLMAQDARVRLDLDDALRRMRVSARRLRSALRTLGPLLDPAWSAELAAELRWLGSALGGARDAEVVTAVLGRMPARLPAHLPTEAVDAAIAAVAEVLRPAAAHEVALAALDSRRYVALLDRLVDACSGPPVTALAERSVTTVAPGLLRPTWERLRRQADALDEDASPPEAYHRVRVLAKRCRYAAETVAPAYGRPARRFAAAVAQAQAALGAHQDAVVAGAVLRRVALTPDRPAELAFALGHVALLVSGEADTARARFHALWPRLRRARHRRWWDDA